LISLVTDSATELLLTVSRRLALAGLHFPVLRFQPSLLLQCSLLHRSGNSRCSVLGLSRSGVCSLHKAPPNSSLGAPSSPLHSAVLTGFPQLPPHGCSTSRSCSLYRCDGPPRCYPPWDRSPLRVVPPLGLLPSPRATGASEETQQHPLMVFQPSSRHLRPRTRAPWQ
jgi:hypothetical protein